MCLSSSSNVVCFKQIQNRHTQSSTLAIDQFQTNATHFTQAMGLCSGIPPYANSLINSALSSSSPDPSTRPFVPCSTFREPPVRKCEGKVIEPLPKPLSISSIDGSFVVTDADADEMI
jgi:hypothetical protein